MREDLHNPLRNPSLFPLLAPLPYSSNERVVPLYGCYQGAVIVGGCMEVVNQLTRTPKGCPVNV